jgi:hypothetical protein
MATEKHDGLSRDVLRALAETRPYAVLGEGREPAPEAATLVVCDDIRVAPAVIRTFLEEGGETLIYRGKWPEDPAFDANPLFAEVEGSFSLNCLGRGEDGVPVSTWSAHLPYRDVLFVEDLDCPECDRDGTVACERCQEWVYCDEHAKLLNTEGCPQCRPRTAEEEKEEEEKEEEREEPEGESLDQPEDITIAARSSGDVLLVCAKRRSRRRRRKRGRRKGRRKKKWMAGAVEEMEEGSLRAIAKRHGLLRSEKDTLSFTDLDKLESMARRRKDTKLLRKVIMARNMMKASKRRRRRRR